MLSRVRQGEFAQGRPPDIAHKGSEPRATIAAPAHYAVMKSNIRSNWSHAILVCRKCSRKQAKRGADFGSRKGGLAKALKNELAAQGVATGKGRKAGLGIVEVPCLDICPKRGVVLVDTRTPDQWRIIGPDADLGDLARDLAESGGG